MKYTLLALIALNLPGTAVAYQGGKLVNHGHTSAAGQGGGLNAGTVSWSGTLPASVMPSTVPAAILDNAGAVYNIRNPAFGATGNGSSDDTTAIQIAVASAALSGGTVFFPIGTYLITSTITVPAQVLLRGANNQGSIIQSGMTAGAYAIQLGNTAGTLSYGNGVEDLWVNLTSTTSNGILLYGTAGAKIKDVYIQGLNAANRTTTCLRIDGANISSFFNIIENVECNHVQTGALVQTSGNTVATISHFIDFNVNGDDRFNSVGIDIGGANGQDGATSTIYGGDLEHLATGLYIQPLTTQVSAFGVRFEANSTDIFLGNGAAGFSGMGLEKMAVITDRAPGYGNHTFLGNTLSTNLPQTNQIAGDLVIASTPSADYFLITSRPGNSSGVQIASSSGTTAGNYTPLELRASTITIHMDNSYQPYTPTFAGCTGQPGSIVARYTTYGKMVHVNVSAAPCTSNATTFTITLPIAAANTAIQYGYGQAEDNTSFPAAMCQVQTRVNSATADIFLDNTAGNWTASGAKKCNFNLVYEGI